MNKASRKPQRLRLYSHRFPADAGRMDPRRDRGIDHPEQRQIEDRVLLI